jgi:XTP/dITP diphosphohydrolase
VRITVRPATPDDFEAVKALFREGDDHHRALGADGIRQDHVDYERKDFDRTLAEASVVVFIAEDKGDVAGFLRARKMETPNTRVHAATKIALVDEVVVAVKSRSQGVGKALVDEVKQWARAQECDGVELNVYASNEAAVAFYLREGFFHFRNRMRFRLDPLVSTGHRRIAGRLVIATHNPGKLAEMRELLAPYGVEAVSAGELSLQEPEETGTSFRANARIKAQAAAAASGLPAFADDSGLAVDALGGEPGIHSARWAGPDKDFGAAMQTIDRLLRERGAVNAEQRQAHFVSALCVAWPDGHVEEFEARVDGTLVWPPRGTQGFGYDPMFLPDGHSRTFGEMPSEEKHGLPPRGAGLSHRARAFVKLAQACLAA